MEDEEMEFLDGTWKKEISSWEDLLGESLLNQEVVLEGAVHSIRNMGEEERDSFRQFLKMKK